MKWLIVGKTKTEFINATYEQCSKTEAIETFILEHPGTVIINIIDL